MENMKKFASEASHVLRDVLNFTYHKRWASIFELIFLDIAGRDTLNLKKFVADAVITNVWLELRKDWSFNQDDDEDEGAAAVALLYALYDNCAERFEKKVRQHIEDLAVNGRISNPF